MVTRSQKIRLAIFLGAAFVILLGTIGIITGNRLFKQKTIYYIRYKEISLSGLELGSAVKYRGIRIGRIEDIYIDEKDITSLIVKISVDKKVPIKEDTEAIVTLIGITGLKMIELTGGSNESKQLAPNSYIKAGLSLVDSISGQAEIITQKLEFILNNLAELTTTDRREQIYQLVDNTSNTMESIHTLVDTNQINLYHTIKNLAQFTNQLDTFMVSAKLMVQDVRKITQSPQLLTTIHNLEQVTTELQQANLANLIHKLTNAIEQTDKTFTHLDLTILKSRHDILSSTEILRESLEYFNEFTRLISENPSLLLRSSQQEEIKGR